MMPRTLCTEQALLNGVVDILPTYWSPGSQYNSTYARTVSFDPAACPTMDNDYKFYIKRVGPCICVSDVLVCVTAHLVLFAPPLATSCHFADAPYTTLDALVAAVKAGTAKIASQGAGSAGELMGLLGVTRTSVYADLNCMGVRVFPWCCLPVP
jgi:hypothetical protein